MDVEQAWEGTGFVGDKWVPGCVGDCSVKLKSGLRTASVVDPQGEGAVRFALRLGDVGMVSKLSGKTKNDL